MRHRPTLPLVLFLLALIGPGLAFAGRDDRPVKMSDVKDMLRDGQTAEQVLVAMSERGLGFRMTAAAERRLKEWGFTDDQIQQVTRLERGLSLQTPEVRGGGKPEDGDKPDAGKQAEFPIGHAYAGNDREAQAEEKRLARAIQGASLGYDLHKLDRFALYCANKQSEELLPAVKAIEAKLAAQLHASLSNATGPTTTLLVLAEHKSDAFKFEKALIASYRVDYPDYGKGTRGTGDWNYQMFRNVIIINTSAYKDGDKLPRLVSFGIGYMIGAQLSQGGAPGPLLSGFGDVVEEKIQGSPSVLFGRDSSPDSDNIEDWKGYIKLRAEKGRLPTARAVLGYDYDEMRDEHYAQAWSLTSFLAGDAKRLHELFTRTQARDQTTIDLVLQTYGLSEKELQQAWVGKAAR